MSQIGAIGTPVYVGKNGLPHECGLNLITGEYYSTIAFKYAEYDETAADYCKKGTKWEERYAADSIQRKAFVIGEPIAVDGSNYKGDDITRNVRPLYYNVQKDSLVNISVIPDYTQSRGDAIDCHLISYSKSGTKTSIRLFRLVEEYTDTDEYHSYQFMCKAGTQFRFTFMTAIVDYHCKVIGGELPTIYWYPVNANKAPELYAINNSTKLIKKGLPGGIIVTEYVLSPTSR